jgi:hypothetical protein
MKEGQKTGSDVMRILILLLVFVKLNEFLRKFTRYLNENIYFWFATSLKFIYLKGAL